MQNVETARTADVTNQPRTILAMQQNGDPFPDIFKATLIRKIAACGITLQFAPQVDGTPINSWPEAEARLTFRELAKLSATVKKRQTGQVVDQFSEMYRYEFALYDVAARRTVWQGQGDFKTHDDVTDVHMVSSARERAAQSWSDELVSLMQKDALLGSCGEKTTSPSPLITAAAPLSQAQEPAALPRSEPMLAAVGSHFTVDGVTYYSLSEAEDALRKHAARELYRVKPLGQPARPSLLLVVPTDAALAAAHVRIPANKTEAQGEAHMAFSQAVLRVALDIEVEAIRKAGLFEQVSVLRDDAVAERDFKGTAYKIWKGPLVWTLSRQSGGQQPIKGPPLGTVTYTDLSSMLSDLENALTALDNAPRWDR